MGTARSIKMCGGLVCGSRITKMLLCGLRGFLFSFILTWLSSRDKVGGNLLTEQRYSDIWAKALGRQIYLSEIPAINIQRSQFTH